MEMFRGRLNNGLGKNVAEYISSLKEDIRLIESDISVIQTHNLMLYKQGYLEKSEIEKILLGLDDAGNDSKLKDKIQNPD